MNLSSAKVPVAYRNGQFLPAADVTLPIYDIGFIQGATITEQLRTFGHDIFRLDQHLERFWRGLKLIEIDQSFCRETLKHDLQKLVDLNSPLLDAADDFGVCCFATPGSRAGFAPEAFFQEQPSTAGPNLIAHVYPLPFSRWSEKYQNGFSLLTSTFHEVPDKCWPKSIKCRSRMHYHLAELDVAKRQPGAVPVLVDHDGNIRDSSMASMLFYDSQQGFMTPGGKETLSSISIDFIKMLAKELDIPFEERSISCVEASNCEEIMLATTPWCVAPVCSFDDQKIDRVPGPISTSLIEAWSSHVGISIAEQAQQFSNRSS